MRYVVAACYGISLRRMDTILLRALDYCAKKTDQPAMADIRSPRRALPLLQMRTS